MAVSRADEGTERTPAAPVTGRSGQDAPRTHPATTMAADRLEKYRSRRRFEHTPEPEGALSGGVAERPQFVVQQHDARRMHYDFRLEHDGVLKSWAVPKGPSLNPRERRLAVQTEDHPLEYATFEGVIPEREYGAGAVLVWDRGYWTPEGDAARALAKGKLDFELYGEKLRGRWTLVRMPARGKRSEPSNWLLIKRRDREARSADAPELVETRPESVLSGRDLAAVAAARDRVWHSDGHGEASPETVPVVGRPGTLPRARRGTLPRNVTFQQPKPVEIAPEEDGWLHEPRLDGRRVACRIRNARASIRDADGSELAERLAAAAGALAALPCKTALIDGVVACFDERGLTDRARLERALRPSGSDKDVVLVALDLLHLDGWNLRDTPLRARKELLRLLTAEAPAVLRYADHVEGHGSDFLREACALGLRGVVSKRADGPYRGGADGSWLLVQCPPASDGPTGGSEPS